MSKKYIFLLCKSFVLCACVVPNSYNLPFKVTENLFSTLPRQLCFLMFFEVPSRCNAEKILVYHRKIKYLFLFITCIF